MPPNALARTLWPGWINTLLGTGELPPPRYALHLHPRMGQLIDGWTVRSFVLDERLHAPYALTVSAVADAAEVDLDALLGGRAVFEIARGDLTRVIHGVVYEADLVDGLDTGHGVELHVVPAFALLGLSRRSRVFQGVSVPSIVAKVMTEVLAEHGGSLCLDRLSRTYEPRDHCVQYRETDLDFVLRILAAEGITLMLDHSTGAETVVLVDDNEALPNAGHEPLDKDDDPPPPVPFVPERADEVPIESIQAVGQRSRLRGKQWTSTAWDWKARPTARLRGNAPTAHEASEGGWWEADEGRPDEGERSDGMLADPTERRATLQRQRDHAGATWLRASTNATALRAGSVFELLAAPHEEYGEKWVATAVRHHGDAPHARVGDSSETAAPEYGNEIECQPLLEPVVPPRMRRPRVLGVHSAIVTGPPGEAIHTDRFGRVRVRMLWDEQEHDDEPTSCWLRVASPWAGDDFGTMFIPRVGAEVIVSFIDGDPDRPFCSAGVYNGAALPPYALPEHKTRTVLRTQTVGGDGHNELSFEDAKGSEEVYLHAQRNLREYVRAHHTTRVGGSQSLAVAGPRSTTIGKDDTTTTTGEHRHTVDGQVTERFRSAYVLRVSEAPKDPRGVKGMSIDVSQGGYDLRAAESIVLRCGDSRLELRPDRIVISSPEVVASCPGEGTTHPTRIAMNGGRVELATDELRGRVLTGLLEADRRVVHGVGPDGGRAVLVLDDDAATLRTGSTIELGTKTLAAVGTSMAVLKGSSCEVEGRTVEIKGDRIAVDAKCHIDIRTPGEVDIRGTEKIKLNS